MEKLIGRYIGSETNETETFYYSANIVNLKITNEKEIQFQIKNFKFSLSPINESENINSNQVEIKKELNKRNLFPPLLNKFGYKFFGTINHTSIDLYRIADWYESSSDKMLFVRSIKVK